MRKNIKRKYKTIFSKKDLKFIKENYFNLGAKSCAEKLPHLTAHQIRTKASRLGVNVNKKLLGIHLRNKEDLSHILNIETPFIAYFLGFIWADGKIATKTSNIRFKIVNEDFKDIKDEIFKLAKSWRFRVEWDGDINHKEQAVLEINHWEFRDFLVEYDYLIKSGASARKILSIIPKKFKHYWWRGFFDGDGGFSDGHGKTRRITLSSTKEQNWDFVDDLCKFLDIGYRLSKYDNNGENGEKHSGSHINFENEAWVKKFFSYIYQGELFGLKRKYNAYLKYLEYKKTSRPNKTSKYKGVCKADGLWRMQIYKGKHYRKCFKNEFDAAKEYDRMAVILHGNKAVLNFSNE